MGQYGIMALCVALLTEGCGQQLRMCLTVHSHVQHKGQEGSQWIFHLHRLTGGGRQSIPALMKKDI